MAKSIEYNNPLSTEANTSLGLWLLEARVGVKSLWETVSQAFSPEKEVPFEKQVSNAIYDSFKNSLRNEKKADGTPILSPKCLRSLEFLGAPLISSVFEKKDDTDFWKRAMDTGILFSIQTSLQNSGVEQEEITLVLAKLQEYQQQAQTITTAEDLKAFKKQNAKISRVYTEYVDKELGKEIKHQDTTNQETYETAKTQYTTDKESVVDSPYSFEVPPREKGKWEYIGMVPYRFDKIQSGKFEQSANWERNKKGELYHPTLCSKTARENAERFGINVPSGNAYDAGRKKQIDDDTFKLSVGKIKYPIAEHMDKKLLSENFSALQSDKKFQQSNVADIYTTSSFSYGHRAFAFLNQTDGKRYVLDPYPIAMSKSTTPILLEEYKSKTNRVVIHAKFYQSSHYVV